MRMTIRKRVANKAGVANNSSAASCAKARAARMPEAIQPMLATLVDEPFSDPDWVFETKLDGFRSVCYLQNGRVRLMSRNQIEMTPQYPELKNLAKQFKAKQAIVDGEIVALDEKGMPRFHSCSHASVANPGLKRYAAKDKSSTTLSI